MDVFSILVTKGNIVLTNDAPTILKKEKKMDILLPGKIGIFDAHTHQTLDEDSTGVRDIYIATGTGEGDTFDSYRKSAGQYISLKNVYAYSKKEYVEKIQKEYTLKLSKARFNTDYTVQMHLMNEEVIKRQGFNQFTKTFSYYTGNKKEGEIVDVNRIILSLYQEMEANKQDFYTVDIYKKDNTKITVAGDKSIYDGALDYLKENSAANTNPDTTSDNLKHMYLKIGAKEQAEKDFININLGYYYPKQYDLTLFLKDGFETDNVGELTVTSGKNLKYSEGDGYDIHQKEYRASGWTDTPGPYKVYTNLGVSKNEFDYQSDIDKTYDQIFLSYTHKNTNSKVVSPLTTIIACEKGSGTEKVTFNKIILVLDALLKPYKIKKLTA